MLVLKWCWEEQAAFWTPPVPLQSLPSEKGEHLLSFCRKSGLSQAPGLPVLVCLSPCPSGLPALPVPAAGCGFGGGRPPAAGLCPSTRRVPRRSPAHRGARCGAHAGRGSGCQASERWGAAGLQPSLPWCSADVFRGRMNLGSVMVWAEVVGLQAALRLLCCQPCRSPWGTGPAEPGQVSCSSCAPLPCWQTGR